MQFTTAQNCLSEVSFRTLWYRELTRRLTLTPICAGFGLLATSKLHVSNKKGTWSPLILVYAGRKVLLEVFFLECDWHAENPCAISINPPPFVVSGPIRNTRGRNRNATRDPFYLTQATTLAPWIQAPLP